MNCRLIKLQTICKTLIPRLLLLSGVVAMGCGLSGCAGMRFAGQENIANCSAANVLYTDLDRSVSQRIYILPNGQGCQNTQEVNHG